MMADLVGRRVLLLDALLQVRTMALPTSAAPGEGSERGVGGGRGEGGGRDQDGGRSGGGGRGQASGGRGEAGGADFVWQPHPGYVRAVLATLARERRPLRVPPMADLGVSASAVLAPVAIGESILGYLAILAEGERASGGEELDLQIVQHAATVYALSMMHERMAADVSRQLKDELFEGVLLGRAQDEQVARERAMRLGYDPRTTYRALVLGAMHADAPGALGGRDGLDGLPGWAGDPVHDREHPRERGQVEPRPEALTQRRRMLESLSELCIRRAPGAFAAIREHELIVLVPDTPSPLDVGSPRSLGQIAVQHAAALEPAWQVTAGIGGPIISASAIARSYAQGRRAIETAQRFGRGGKVIAFEDLGVYRLLFHVTDPAELRGFVDQVLGPLIVYDQQHNADLVRTLGTYLAHNGNLQATSRELSLHVNSVAYRLQRVQAIAGVDLEQSEDRLQAQVALKILAGVP
jgi:PucR family transcriptional regulator, purine catabolism regulatory protein